MNIESPLSYLVAVRTYYTGPPLHVRKRKAITAEEMSTRFLAIYLARSHGAYSLPVIGEAFGRDHTTIQSAINTVLRQGDERPEIRAALAAVEQALAPVTTILRVVIETPYSWKGMQREGETVRVTLARHRLYTLAAIEDSLRRGEAPYASHLLYPQVLDDDDPAEREIGIRAGLAWGATGQIRAVYADLGITAGMRKGIESALAHGQPVEYRSLPTWGVVGGSS